MKQDEKEKPVVLEDTKTYVCALCSWKKQSRRSTGTNPAVNHRRCIAARRWAFL